MEVLIIGTMLTKFAIIFIIVFTALVLLLIHLIK